MTYGALLRGHHFPGRQKGLLIIGCGLGDGTFADVVARRVDAEYRVPRVTATQCRLSLRVGLPSRTRASMTGGQVPMY
jgi:hypothetical protein